MHDLTWLPPKERRYATTDIGFTPDLYSILTIRQQVLLDALATAAGFIEIPWQGLLALLPDSTRPDSEQALVQEVNDLAALLAGHYTIHRGRNGVGLHVDARRLLVRYVVLEDGAELAFVLPCMSICVRDPGGDRQVTRHRPRLPLFRTASVLATAGGRSVTVEQLEEASGCGSIPRSVMQLRRLPLPIRTAPGAYWLDVVTDGGPLEIDPEGGYVRQHGRRSSIRGVPMRVLTCIARLAGSPVSCDDICADVWDDRPRPNAVRRAVWLLRRELDPSGELRLIETGRDAEGRLTYQFNAEHVEWLGVPSGYDD